MRAGRRDERVHGLGRRVDLADADDALVGVHPDDQIVLAAVRDPVVQHGLAQDDGLDIGDLQTSSCGRRTLIVNYTRLSTIAKRMPDSPVHCSIDLDAPGKHVGRLELPRSNNTSGWSHQFIPIVSIKGGDGPTALVIGGVHGDEPEGQIAALRLARETEPGDVPGQLIVVPCASPDASRAYTRLWPSGANFNRSFPGSPDGPPDEQLADFFSRFLFPRADVVVDMHSGGRSGLCPPWSEMHWVDDADAAARDGRCDARLGDGLQLRLHRHRRHAACLSARPSGRARSSSRPSSAAAGT